MRLKLGYDVVLTYCFLKADERSRFTLIEAAIGWSKAIVSSSVCPTHRLACCSQIKTGRFDKRAREASRNAVRVIQEFRWSANLKRDQSLVQRQIALEMPSDSFEPLFALVARWILLAIRGFAKDHSWAIDITYDYSASKHCPEIRLDSNDAGCPRREISRQSEQSEKLTNSFAFV